MIEMEPTFIKSNGALTETCSLYRKHMVWKGEKSRQKQISESGVVCLP